MQMKDRNEKSGCLLCGGKRRKMVHKFADLPKSRRGKQKLDIKQCSKCGFIATHPPLPNDHWNDKYEGDYWREYQTSIGEKRIDERFEEFEMISAERIHYLEQFYRLLPPPLRFNPQGRFLDVGCSMGFLVKAAEDYGFKEAFGIDPNQQDVDEGIERYDVALSQGYIEDYDNGTFDVIMCFNTVEHVPRPDRLMEEMANRLKPNGVLVVGTHDIECNNYVQQGVEWKHIKPAEHLYYFSKNSLALLGRKYGVRPFWTGKPIENSIVTYFIRG
jgi:2-polyprenyl-3-methyl-5-hydroxy-6-metoxy-1,4-benzoquinol methylase